MRKLVTFLFAFYWLVSIGILPVYADAIKDMDVAEEVQTLDFYQGYGALDIDSLEEYVIQDIHNDVTDENLIRNSIDYSETLKIYYYNDLFADSVDISDMEAVKSSADDVLYSLPVYCGNATYSYHISMGKAMTEESLSQYSEEYAAKLQKMVGKWNVGSHTKLEGFYSEKQALLAALNEAGLQEADVLLIQIPLYGWITAACYTDEEKPLFVSLIENKDEENGDHLFTSVLYTYEEFREVDRENQALWSSLAPGAQNGDGITVDGLGTVILEDYRCEAAAPAEPVVTDTVEAVTTVTSAEEKAAPSKAVLFGGILMAAVLMIAAVIAYIRSAKKERNKAKK